MPDIVRAQTENLPTTMETRWLDMGDGTHAPVVASVPVGVTEPGEAPQQLLTDEITSALVTIPVVHHEVHEGETFTVSTFSILVNNGDDITMLLRTGNTRYGHLTFVVAAGGDAQVRLLENPTITNIGNGLNERNMKRYSTEIPEIQAFGNPAYIEQAVIMNFLAPGGTGGNAVGGTSRQDTEWILSLNTDYVIELTNISGNNQPMSIVAQWYEESTA